MQGQRILLKIRTSLWPSQTLNSCVQNNPFLWTDSPWKLPWQIVRGPMPPLKDLITYICLQLQMPLVFRKKPRKGKDEAVFCGLFFNVCFILFWFWLFWFGHTRRHLTCKIMYANVLTKWAYYSGTTRVILLYITLLDCYQIQLWGVCQEVDFLARDGELNKMS